MPDAKPNTAQQSPAFLIIDQRAPASVRELILEADGCVKAGFLTGGTVCAQRAIALLMEHEGAQGATYEARLHALSQKFPSVRSRSSRSASGWEIQRARSIRRSTSND
jgi:hypothetical protein